MGTGFIVMASAIGLVSLLIFLKTLQKKLREEILQRFNKEDVILSTTRANFFGVKSEGSAQIRGNGALVLTKDQLSFLRALPAKEYAIPVQKIKEVSTPKSFLGKSIFRKLLCVHYEAFEDESIAWAVSNVDEWKEAIEALVKK